MKKNVLLILAMMTCSLLCAQGWEKPSAANLPRADVLAATENGDSTFYYLYNIGGDGFLSNRVCSGHAPWDTHAALLDVGRKIIVEKYSIADPGTNEPAWDGKTWNILNNWNDRWLYVFPTSDYMMYVDWNGQADHMWEIVSKGDGIFNIKVSDYNPTYNDAAFGYTSYMGFNAYDTDFLENNSVKPLTPMLDPTNSHVEYDTDAKIDWCFIPESAYLDYLSKLEIYEAAMALKAEIERCQVLIDVSEAQAIFNNTSSTLEQLREAVLILQKQYRAAEVNAVLNGATEQNPMDATSLIKNSTFEEGVNGQQPPYWTVEPMGNNNGFQNNNIYENGKVVLNQFIESWIDANTSNLKNGAIYQILQDMPAGKYVLSADVMTNNQKNTSLTITGVELFAIGGDLMATKPANTHFFLPEHFELPFVSSGGDIKLGVRTNSTNANWIAADNFTLWYYGEVQDDPHKIVLDELIAQLESSYPQINEIKAEQQIKDQYVSELEKAKSVTEGYDEEEAILKAIAEALKESISQYNQLAALITVINDNMEKFSDIYPELEIELGDLLMEWEDAYTECSANAEYIAQAEPTMNKMISDYILAHISPGTDLTFLIANSGFDKDVSGWINEGGIPAHGGLGTTGGRNLLGDVPVYSSGNAEVWHNTINMYQVINGLPKGSYTITCQAFERNEPDYKTYWSEGPEVGLNAYLFANENKTLVGSIMRGAQPEEVFQGSNNWNDEQTSYGFIPDNMDAVNFYFNISPETYKVSVNVILKEDGEPLKLGIYNDYKSSWVIFDNFHLTYNGESVDAYFEQIDELISRLSLTINSENMLGKDAVELVNAAIDALTSARNGSDFDACVKAIKDGEAAYEYAKESIDLYMQMNSLYYKISDAKLQCETTATQKVLQEASELMTVISQTLINCDKTNDEVRGLIEEAKSCIISLVSPGIDLTFLIANPGFDKDVSGWINEGAIPVHGGLGTTGGHNLLGDVPVYSSGDAEVWHNKINMYQIINGLPKGSYTVTCQAFERNEPDYKAYWSEGPEVGLNAYLFANENKTLVGSIMRGAQPQEVFRGSNNWNDEQTSYGFIPDNMDAVNFYFNISPETYKVSVNVILEEDDEPLKLGLYNDYMNSWVIFDNFHLTYNGTSADACSEQIDDLLSRLSLTINSDNMIGKDAVELVNAAIDALTSARNGSDFDACVKAINNGEKAYEYAKESIDLYIQINSLYYEISDATFQYEKTATQKALQEASDLMTVISQTLINFDKTNDEVRSLIEEAKFVITGLRLPDLSMASESNPVDVTAVIINPNFDDDTHGWDYDGATPVFGGKGSTGGKNTIGDVELMNSGNAEIWFKAFDFYQVINYLPNGSYTLTCKAFERHDRENYVGMYNPEDPQAGMKAKLYANDDSTTITSIVSGAQPKEVFRGNKGGNDEKTSYGYIPNSMDGANFYFALAPEVYLNTVSFTLSDADSSLRIGIRTDFTQSWLIWDEFRLTYYGEGDITDNISSLKNYEEITGNAIYNLAGQRLNVPQKGINIINGRKYLHK